MRKTLAQLILLLAFLCVAWIALQTVWKSTAPIPEGFVTPLNVNDIVNLKDDPNPNRQRIGADDGKCLDFKPKGSVGKVLAVGIGYSVIQCKDGLTGLYFDTDLVINSDPALAPLKMGDDVTLNDDPNPNRQRLDPNDGKCLDSQPKGSVAKIVFTGHHPQIGPFASVKCKDGSTGYYIENDLKKYSEAVAASATYNPTYNPNSLPAAKQRVYECKSGNVSGIKRADQCRCLPGYIPYKTDCGTYVCQNTSDSTVIKNCY